MKAKQVSALGLVLVSLAWPVAGYSQSAPAQGKPAAAAPLPAALGEVRRLDLEGGKITIKHGEIKTLDMPPMTMVFVAKDKAQLANLKVGDKISFVGLTEAGKFIAADIQAAK